MLPQSAPPPATDIARLAYTDRFVSELPSDPRTDAALRQVHAACYSRTTPTEVPAPELLALVPEVAHLLRLAPHPTPELVAVLAGNRVVPGMVPYAACYGGHQFGNWAGQLGDGRAITLGEVVGIDEDDAEATWEFQLKGAGPTPYSRRADGRAVLRSSLRELVCSEAMHHLHVPTTRALSLVATGQPVLRDLLYDGNPRHEPGAVVCRVAPSFLRFGSYELPSSRDDHATLRTLVRFTLARFYPQYLDGERMDVTGWFAEVARRTAFLMAEWMRVGFVHGVMNTDNMSILGLTIDYGPYGWLEAYDPDWTPNITDASGRRYRYGHQAQVGQWNLAQLARALAPLCQGAEVEALRETVVRYAGEVASLHRHSQLRKLGLTGFAATATEDDDLLAGLAELLVADETDMPLWFRLLAQVPTGSTAAAAAALLRDASYAPEAQTPVYRALLGAWLRRYGARVQREGIDDRERRARMDAVNPLYVPRNYLVQEVIEATEAGDRSQLAALLEVLRRPYDEQPGQERYARKRPEWARVKPGCSMLSCSS